MLMEMSRRATPGSRRHRFRANLFTETLETRRLLSTATLTDGSDSDWTASPLIDTVIGPFASTPQVPSGALTPAIVRQAHGFDKIVGDGTGQTIAIVDAYHDPTALTDLKVFDAAFGLPDPVFTQVDQYGGKNYPSVNSGWAQEIALDVQWAHAIAPGAKILLVEARSASTADLMTAVAYAAQNASVVSMSWGGSEWSGEKAYDTTFAKTGVTFVAASGDDGGSTGASWPSVSPYVLSVGGTTLVTTSTGAYSSETAWSGTSSGSGGGVSRYESLPSYQAQALGATYSRRATPDVAYDANPGGYSASYKGFAVYTTTGGKGWYTFGGTSAGAPQWAALVALADQARASKGMSSLSSLDTLKTVYSLATTEFKSTPSAYFHDVTSGSNAAGRAVKGYDLVTGLGSPVANTLVAYASGQSVSASLTAASVSQAGPVSTSAGTATTVITSSAVSIVAISQGAAPVVSDVPSPLDLSAAARFISKASEPATGTTTAATNPSAPPAPPAQPLLNATAINFYRYDNGERTPEPELPKPGPIPEPVLPGDWPTPEEIPVGETPDGILAGFLWDRAIDDRMCHDQDKFPIDTFNAPAADPAHVTDPPVIRIGSAAAGAVVAIIWGLREASERSDRRRRPFDPVW